jgi:general secretion pathway protein G
MNRRSKAFTLVELLIVVVILGILAAVVIPQFSDAGTDARFSSLQTNLATIRGQIELYKLQHNGEYPPAASFATVMTAKTNADHTATGTPALGPYLQRVPANPFDNSTDIAAAAGGWEYEDVNGTFLADDGGTTNGVAHSSL